VSAAARAAEAADAAGKANQAKRAADVAFWAGPPGRGAGARGGNSEQKAETQLAAADREDAIAKAAEAKLTGRGVQGRNSAE
jgi:hypothetical protein